MNNDSHRLRAGLAAVLAGLTFMGALAQFLRYEVVIPGDGALGTELCVVLDRWTGETRPCTDEALSRYERWRAEPQGAELRRAENANREESLWRQVAGFLIEMLEIEKWLPSMTGRI